jgi:hypothetical protein
MNIMAKTKLDLKKQFPELYNPSKEPHITEIPEMIFFMVDGKGYPVDNPLYQEAMQLLYGVSFSLKMKIIKPTGRDYVVPPLEGLWWADDMSVFTKDYMERKNEWKWTSMIRIPDFIKEEQIKKGLGVFKESKNPENFNKLRHQKYTEGTVVQVLHLGPFSEEGPVIERMHEYAIDQGYILHKKHHEIYLSDPRRTKPEKLRTVIRQPINKKE